VSAGANLALAKSGAGQQLHLINVTSYVAGNTRTDCCNYLLHLLVSAGANLALAKSGAGQQLDLINVMSYDAGNIQSTGFNRSESYMAHRSYWRTQAIALGVQVGCVHMWNVLVQNCSVHSRWSRWNVPFVPPSLCTLMLSCCGARVWCVMKSSL
jgi:hypothetical protein